MTCVLVWDASPLVHAHRIDRLDVLGDIAHGPCSAPWANYTTAAVVEELGQHGGSVPDWLRVVYVDGISELRALARWVGRVSSETHSQGEATVLAWAECHDAHAIIDDADVRRVAQLYGLSVHGVLWVVAQAVEQGRWSATSASNFVDRLIGTGARYPFEVAGFVTWARSVGLTR